MDIFQKAENAFAFPFAMLWCCLWGWVVPKHKAGSCELCICVSVYVCVCLHLQHREKIQQYFTQMRNVILQIKTTQCLVLSLFMPFYFLLCWHGCTCREALKDIIGVVKNYWEARTFPCSDPPLLFPICHHLMWQSFYRALRQRRLKVNTAIRKQLGGKCNTFHTKLNSSST